MSQEKPPTFFVSISEAGLAHGPNGPGRIEAELGTF